MGELFAGISRLIGFSQVGGQAWFGATDAMDDLMPWGRGTLVTREGSGGGGEAPDPAPRETVTRNLPFYHAPVLLAEVVELLQPAPGKLIFDGTLGGGGHSEALLQHGARVVAMDQDVNALKHATERLKPYAAQFCALRGNFRNFPQIVEETGVSGFDGMLVDIGVSSHQLDDAARGFSFMRDGPLDLRMDTESARTAADLVNTEDEAELMRIFFEYGEEPNARRIARAIVKARATQVIKNTLQFAEQTLQHLAAPFIDRPEWPEARKNPDCVLKLITRKPVQATPQEIELNPRARSAVLRVAERLPA